MKHIDPTQLHSLPDYEIIQLYDGRATFCRQSLIKWLHNNLNVNFNLYVGVRIVSVRNNEKQNAWYVAHVWQHKLLWNVL